MNTLHKIHPLTSNDTIISVATKLDLSVKEIKAYHNEYADADDIIENDFPLHLRALLLPPDKNEPFIQEEKIPTPVPLTPKHSIAFTSSTQKIKYGIQYVMENGSTMNTIKYECTVQWKEKDEEGNHLFEIDRATATFINDKEPDTLSAQLAAKAGSILYPLQIIVNKNGQWLEVYNHQELKERFTHTKNEMLAYYKGAWAEKYMKACEQIFEDKTSLKKALNGDLFLASFFTDIYISYPQDLIAEKHRDFPLQPHVKAPQFKITQEVAPYLDEYNKIQIEQKGVLDEERALMDFESDLDYPYYASLNPNEPKAQGSFEATYCLNPKDNTIESVVIQTSLELDEPRSVTVMIASIEEEEKKSEAIETEKLKTSVLVDG
jgi:hypothetical protein